jgi:hypothetical protein
MVRNNKHKLSRDYFFKTQKIQSIIEMLQLSLNEHPDQIVFEYLMAHYLLNKELMNIIHFLPFMDKISYREIPLKLPGSSVICIQYNT